MGKKEFITKKFWWGWVVGGGVKTVSHDRKGDVFMWLPDDRRGIYGQCMIKCDILNISCEGNNQKVGEDDKYRLF